METIPGEVWCPSHYHIVDSMRVANESFSKYNAVTLDYQGLNYELIPQRNGNFNTEQSSETEMF